MGKEIVTSGNKDLGEPIIPDQVLTLEELSMAEELAEEGLEPLPPNWPPEKGLIVTVKSLLSEIQLAIKNPNFYRIYRQLEKESRRREKKFRNGRI